MLAGISKPGFCRLEKNCIRKKRFEEEGYVSADYVLPDGSVDESLK